MSLIWPGSKAKVVRDQARLHAFVIAVADYPHLKGGAKNDALDSFGLSQISTPMHTGLAISDWLLNTYKNAQQPLGSLEVLLSPSEPVAATKAAPATMSNIRRAFDGWLQRCNSHAENIALLYFCGHGLAKGAQYLLAQDFGNPKDADIWDKCIDFDGLRVGMRGCKAQTQLFFVDACRETPFNVLTQLNPHGIPLITASFNDSPVASSSAYYATTEGLQAYGPADGPTYFSQALLCCLNGVASLNRNGKWEVDTFSLSNALGQTMAQYARRYKLPLGSNSNPSGLATIHEAPSPRVMIAIECSSQQASDVANIRVFNGASEFNSPPGDAKPLIEDVDAGEWSVEITFPGGEFAPQQAQQLGFFPPVFEGVPLP